MISLNACAMGGSEGGGGACPPVVEYSRAEQQRAAREIDTLSEGAILTGILSDYAVLREQAHRCLDVMSRQVVAGNPRYWGFAIESEVGAVVVVMIQEWREGISALI